METFGLGTDTQRCTGHRACWAAAAGMRFRDIHGHMYGKLPYDPFPPQCVEEVMLSMAVTWLRQSPLSVVEAHRKV